MKLTCFPTLGWVYTALWLAHLIASAFCDWPTKFNYWFSNRFKDIQTYPQAQSFTPSLMQQKIMSANLSTLKTQTYHLCKHQRVICFMWSHLVRKTYLDKIPTKFVTWKGVNAIYFSRTWQALKFPLFARGILVQCSYLWWMKEKFLIFNLMRKCGIFYWATDGENVQNVDFE